MHLTNGANCNQIKCPKNCHPELWLFPTLNDPGLPNFYREGAGWEIIKSPTLTLGIAKKKKKKTKNLDPIGFIKNNRQETLALNPEK